MRKVWLVALNEYRKHVFTRRFVFGLLSVPLVIILMVGLIFLIISLEINTTPIGYVDASGLLSNPVPPPKPTWPDVAVSMLAFGTRSGGAHSPGCRKDPGLLPAAGELPGDRRTAGGAYRAAEKPCPAAILQLLGSEPVEEDRPGGSQAAGQRR